MQDFIKDVIKARIVANYIHFDALYFVPHPNF